MMAEHLHANHRQRLKNRFLQGGLDDFEPHNALELILFFGIPQRDTNELAHRLIDKFGSFNRVLDAPYEELVKVKGMGDNSACLIKLMTPVFRYYMKNSEFDTVNLDTPDKVGEYLTGCFAGFTEEHVSLLSLDDMCNVLSMDFVSTGDVSSANLRFRTIIETVIKTKAASVILCHNHPGGVAIPSDQDVESTKRVKDLLKNVGVCLLDHFIIGQDDFVSMAQSPKYQYLFI